ncbi:MAG: hypothetical protein EP330_17990 [Deltaproteobacteria bacterium]|nr:MAG: hypothetical protein EP330_17990 [Deltaproteobacteria bacterium]
MRHLVLVLAAVGCAPTHVPRAGSFALLDGDGDVHAAATVGSHGASLEVTHALSEHFAIRGGGQFAPTPSYLSTWMGSGFYTAEDVFRFGIFGEFGAGAANSTTDYTVNGEANTAHNAGYFVHGGATVEFGVEWPNFAAGFGTRGVVQRFWHASGSDGVVPGTLVNIEPMLMLRGGAPTAKIEVQFGIALPFPGVDPTGDMGVYLPYPRLSVGYTFDKLLKNRHHDPELPTR